MNYKRKKSKYNFKCALCNSSRAATMQGDFHRKELRNNQKIKEIAEDIKDMEYPSCCSSNWCSCYDFEG